jgi:hypothetical protein
MGHRLIRRDCAVWLALLAALLNALAPLAAYATARANVLPVEICTAHGLSPPEGEVWIPLPVPPPEDSKPSWQCGCCATGCTAFLALTSGDAQANGFDSPIEARVRAQDAARAETHSCFSPRPRGPPNT